MIHRLTIERFRGIRELTLRDLGRVNLIVGENNSGKSTLLEAIDLTLTNHPYVLPRPHYKSGWESGSGSLLRSLRMAFYRSKGKSILVKTEVDFPELGRGELRTEATLESGEISDQSELVPGDGEISGVFRVSPFERPVAVTLDIEAVLPNAEPSGARLVYPLLRDNQFMPLRRSVAKDFPKLPTLASLDTDRNPGWVTASLVSNLIRNGQLALIEEALREMEPDLKRIVVLAEDEPLGLRSVVEVEREGIAFPFPLASMGEGFASVIDSVATLAFVPQGVCTIDEIENGIHYSAQEDLWRAVRTVVERTDAQLWATTHSYECVRAAWEVFKDAPADMLRVHRLERRPDGSHRTRTMDDITLPILFQNEAEIR